MDVIMENCDLKNKYEYQKKISIILTMILVFALISGANSGKTKQEVTECRELHIVDEKGNPRIVMGTSQKYSGVGITFFSENKNERGLYPVRMSLGMAGDDFLFTFYDSKGNLRMNMAITGDGGALSFADSNNKYQISMEVNELDGPRIMIRDKIGEYVIRRPD